MVFSISAPRCLLLVYGNAISTFLYFDLVHCDFAKLCPTSIFAESLGSSPFLNAGRKEGLRRSLSEMSHVRDLAQILAHTE